MRDPKAASRATQEGASTPRTPRTPRTPGRVTPEECRTPGRSRGEERRASPHAGPALVLSVATVEEEKLLQEKSRAVRLCSAAVL